MELIKPAPSVVHLCGRDDSGELDCEIGGNKVFMKEEVPPLMIKIPEKEAHDVPN